jgi:hypothetical protein
MSDETTTEQNEEAAPAKPECFVVMPISDQPGYDAGHFTRVYEDILKPACDMAGYKPVRADDVREANLIHVDIVKRILDSPMVLCDLSARNPNVMFELGIRQAFDKPVVLVQEVGMQHIFDVGLIRTEHYRRQRIYHEVLEDQKRIADVLRATASGNGVNSVVRLLGLKEAATIPNYEDLTKNNPALQLVLSQLAQLQATVSDLVRYREEPFIVGRSTFDLHDRKRRQQELEAERVRMIQVIKEIRDQLDDKDSDLLKQMAATGEALKVDESNQDVVQKLLQVGMVEDCKFPGMHHVKLTRTARYWLDPRHGLPPA